MLDNSFYMLYSMTGFGREEGAVHGRQIIVEIKSLNGKQLDVTTKLPPILRPYELEIRGMLSEQIIRGTVEIVVTVMQNGANKPLTINTELAGFYYQGMKQIADRFDLPQEHILSTIMRMPEVVAMEQDAMPGHEWQDVRQLVVRAVEKLMSHRQSEGASTDKDLRDCIHNIEKGLAGILTFEPKRIEKIRNRISSTFGELGNSVPVDANRLEQELIYYIERIDFSEEKTRLTQHCNFFMDILSAKDEIAKGKRLGFILQEIGREINTLGAKANDADIQKLIVGMKDELEKAKEQVLNVL